MIGEDSCSGATRAMLAYARAMMRGEDTPRLGKDGLGAADRFGALFAELAAHLGLLQHLVDRAIEFAYDCRRRFRRQ